MQIQKAITQISTEESSFGLFSLINCCQVGCPAVISFVRLCLLLWPVYLGLGLRTLSSACLGNANTLFGRSFSFSFSHTLTHKI